MLPKWPFEISFRLLDVFPLFGPGNVLLNGNGPCVGQSLETLDQCWEVRLPLFDRPSSPNSQGSAEAPSPYQLIAGLH